MTLTPDLVHEAVRRFTAADGIFAVTERQVAGVPRRVFAHAAPTVLDILTSGRGHGGTDFLVFGDRRWSFEQFFADVDALAAVLQHDMGVNRGNRIAIAMRNCPDWVLVFAAAVHVGAVPVLINSWGSAEELEFTLRDSDPTVLAADLPRTRLATETLRQRRTALLFSDVDGGVEQFDDHPLTHLDVGPSRTPWQQAAVAITPSRNLNPKTWRCCSTPQAVLAIPRALSIAISQ